MLQSEIWEIKRMRKQCVPGAPPIFARAGDEARVNFTDSSS